MKGKKIFFYTNMSKLSRTELHCKLTRLGFSNIDPTQCYTSAEVTAQYLLSIVEDKKKVYVVGDEKLKLIVQEKGFEVVNLNEVEDRE
jgi:ribonucleotide monophosphatase NagD (HAD superfamily)